MFGFENCFLRGDGEVFEEILTSLKSCTPSTCPALANQIQLPERLRDIKKVAADCATLPKIRLQIT